MLASLPHLRVVQALVEFAGEGFKGGGGEVADGAAEEFLADDFEFALEVSQVVVGRGGQVIEDLVAMVTVTGVEFGLGLAVPGDEGGFGDAQVASDGGEAQALEAEP